MINARGVSPLHVTARGEQEWVIDEFASASRHGFPGILRMSNCLASVVLVAVTVVAVLILAPGAVRASERTDGSSWPSGAGGQSLIL